MHFALPLSYHSHKKIKKIMEHTVNGTIYAIDLSEDRATVTIWAGGNFEELPVEHFGATREENEEQIANQVKDWLNETWGER